MAHSHAEVMPAGRLLSHVVAVVGGVVAAVIAVISAVAAPVLG